MSRRGRNADGGTKGDGWEEWGGYMNAKRQKLQEQFDQEAPSQLKKEGSGSKIFSGISIHVNGYTKPSSDELKRLMMLHGGNYETYLYRTRVTHVIATNLPNSKVKELKGLKVVRPEWITDSIAAGRLLSYTKYLLYTAQSGGIQKGLQSYTTTQRNQSIVDTQSRQDDTQSTRLFNSESDNTENQSCSKDKVDNVELDLDDGHLVKINQSHVNNSYSIVNESTVHGDTISDVPRASRAVSTNVSPATAGDPKFLNEFYSNSRLHFLSTWKAEWKSYVNELQNKGDNFPGRERLRKIVMERELTPDEFVENSSKRRYVMHVDMDCFFVSVGLRKRPDLKGKPVAVTHSRGKGYKPDPKSDLNLERQQWELRRLQGGKKGRRKTGLLLMTEIKEGDTSFPDISDDSDNDDVISEVSDVAKESVESFHSMAEIASCSYEARKAGVKNGMFMGRAKGICPELVTIPYDFDGYKAVSRILYDTVASYTHDIEAVSCDEMLIDCTDLLRNTGATPLEFSSLLRSEIFEKTGCTASAGIGSSILLARMATRKAKPNGQFHLIESLVVDYISSQPVKDLPGVGWSLTKRFEALKVITCGDLQRISLESLQKEFGPKTGQSLYRYCRGLDDRLVKMEQQRKSVSAEVNYGIRFTLDSEAVKFMEELSSEVCSRLKSIKMKGKTITLKLMVRRKDAPKETSKFMGHGICNNFSKSVTLPMSTDEPRIVARETVGLLRQHKVEPEDLRGIGIQVQKLEPAEVGTVGTSKRLPSILNYTVNTKSISSESKHDNPKSDNCAQDSSVVNDINDRAKPGAIKCNASKESRPGTSIGDFVRTKHSHGTSMTEVSGTTTRDSTGNVGTKNQLKQNVPTFSNDTVDMELYDDGIEADGRSLDVASRCSDEDFVEDLGRRFEAQSQLPPLPSFPDIRTPESAKKVVLAKTPDIPTQEVDYFPSPSQVDPEVLRELPLEIREQIEKEIGNRRKKKVESKVSAGVVKSVSGAGCSNWQPDRGENSPDNGNRNKGGNKTEGTIVALPSPSQIDPSCMEALPESLQAEIRQAYAKQDSNRRVNVKGGNTLQLKQAQSPVKSPGKNRRSPGKNSPNFKVPRGRPSGRGRKKSSSKKTLFKDQNGSIPQNTTDSSLLTVSRTSKHSALPSTSYAVIHRSDDFIDLCPESNENMHHDSAMDKEIECDNLASDTAKYKQHSVSSDGSDRKNCDDKNCVSLCGAVTLKEVKLLVKEWITSTPVPQQEDEEVLMKYLHTLVIVKNLELVDLILKFILRNMHTVNSAEWMYSLQRVYSYIQTVVYQIYGSRLASITL